MSGASNCQIHHELARAEFVRLYRQAAHDIYEATLEVPPIDWVAHMIGVAATYDWELREQVRALLMWAVRVQRQRRPRLGCEWVEA